MKNYLKTTCNHTVSGSHEKPNVIISYAEEIRVIIFGPSALLLELKKPKPNV
jgi:hypothetical protein